MTTTTTKTTIKSKTENESLPSYPSSPTNPNVRPSTTRTAVVIHVYPPSSELFYGARLYRMGGPSGAAPPPFSFFVFSPPMELRATQHPPPHPTHGPEVLRQPTTQHSTISLSTPLYVFPCEDFGTGIQFWVCAFNILLNELFLFMGLLFLFFFVFIIIFFCSLFFPMKLLLQQLCNQRAMIFLCGRLLHKSRLQLHFYFLYDKKTTL